MVIRARRGIEAIKRVLFVKGWATSPRSVGITIEAKAGARRRTTETDVTNVRDTDIFQGLCESFKLPTGDLISGIADRPGVSCDNQNYSDYSNIYLPTQSFINCFINNVEVHALIDTGSMRTFISSRIHNIDFDRTLINTTVEERCVSITGGSLNILGHLNANVRFPKSKNAHEGRFLVSDNISYDCVLGWDFLKQNKLSLQGNFDNGNSF